MKHVVNDDTCVNLTTSPSDESQPDFPVKQTSPQKEEPAESMEYDMYAGWKLDYPAGKATLCPRAEVATNITLDLQRNCEDSLYEAWWPGKPSRARREAGPPEVVISGCCLLDGRWQLEFSPRAKKSKPACRRMSHAQDREDAYKRLRKGHKASRIYMPTSLTGYHTNLISWQVQQLKKWSGCHLYYLLPRSEYHYYVSEMEQELGFECPKMHALLDDFADLVRDEVLAQLEGSGVEVTFISPLADWGLQSPLESYLSPYLRAKELCDDTSRVVGLEDLMENYLPREAFLKTGIEVSLLGGVVGNPHPFKNKALIDGHYAVIELDP